MANTITIKRKPLANGVGVPGNLSPGELAFSEADAKLFYGLGTDTPATPIEIAGSGYVLTQISNNAPTKTGGGATGTWNINVTGNAGTVTNGVYTSRTLTAGSGLVGGGDLSSDKTFNIGQGDGITVSADSIAVNNTVVRTIPSTGGSGGSQEIFGNTKFNTADGGSFTVGNGNVSSFLELVSNTDHEGGQNTTRLITNPPASGTYDIVLPNGSGVLATLADIDAQNIFKNIAVSGQSTVVADSNNDTLTLVAGSNVTITTNASTDTITISSTNTTYSGSTSVVLNGSSFERAALTGDVIASGNSNVTTIANDAVTNAKAANMVANTIKGRITASTGDPEDLTATQVRTILNVADGANNYVHPTDGANTTISSGNLKVLSAITVNNLGHVTSVSSKDLTANDIPNLSTDKLTSGILGVARGGIGTNTLTQNNILVGNGTNAISAPYSVETTLTGGSSAIPRADAVKTYVDNLLGANDAMVFKGTIGTGGTVTALPTTHSAGWTYRVITAGTYAGKACEIGDLLIAIIDRGGSSNSNDDWTVVQTNIDGAVVGPASSTDNAIAVFNGATGKLIKNSSFVPTTVGGNLINLTNPSAIRFLRVNADNSVSALSDSDFRTAIGAGTSSTVGTVTSVTAGSGMSFTSITSSGPVNLGTPSSITLNTANSLTSNSHTHAFAPGGTSGEYIRGDGVLATLCNGIANCVIDGGTF